MSSHLEKNPLDSELSARIFTYELAYKMQTYATEAIDLNKELRRPGHYMASTMMSPVISAARR